MREGLRFTTPSSDLFSSSTGTCAIDAIVKVPGVRLCSSALQLLAPGCLSFGGMQVSQGHLFLLTDAICFLDKVVWRLALAGLVWQRSDKQCCSQPAVMILLEDVRSVQLDRTGSSLQSTSSALCLLCTACQPRLVGQACQNRAAAPRWLIFEQLAAGCSWGLVWCAGRQSVHQLCCGHAAQYSTYCTQLTASLLLLAGGVSTSFDLVVQPQDRAVRVHS